MNSSVFYQFIEKELNEILDDLGEKLMLPHKKAEQRKSYAFLIWILKFYGLTENYKDYITDGAEDNSCDIILNKKNQSGEMVYYIIQSKWNTIGNISSKIDSSSVKQTLNDFDTILTGKRNPTKNQKFNKKLGELGNHLKKNGIVKFLFIALCQSSEDTEENISAFRDRHRPRVFLDVLDINRIKRDFIEMRYKNIVIDNPLNFDYQPEDVPIVIEIERDNNSKRDLIEFTKSKTAFILLIKPKVIYNLFKKFGFQLFYRNLRNPLPDSSYNEQIANTFLNDPESFWFYNNGITGITTKKIEIGGSAKQIEIGNLQIINGAQTLYTVYKCYSCSTKSKRQKLDNDVRISFRLIVSDDNSFNQAITHYTNSQNPLLPADFHANDDIQERLQVESYAYDLWYEKRRGEFRSKSEGITIIDKEVLTGIYLACHLEEPILATNERAYHFVSSKNHSNGLYEFIFNDLTNFADMLASFRLFKVNIISTYSRPGIDSPPDDRTLMPFLTLSKIVLRKCLQEKFKTSDLNINNYILVNHEKDEFRENHMSARAFVATNIFNKLFLNIGSEDSQKNFNLFMGNRAFFQEIKNWFNEMELSFDIIENYNKDPKLGPLLP